jgi:histidine triad (HIT) family protein
MVGDAMSEKTIFGKIIDREIPAEIVYEDDLCLAFRDIAPQAPTHVLVIPKKEIPTLDDLTDEDQQLMGHMVLAATKLARQLGVDGGYRLVVNCGPEAGQEVYHLHIHLLAGRKMKWPPG